MIELDGEDIANLPTDAEFARRFHQIDPRVSGRYEPVHQIAAAVGLPHGQFKTQGQEPLWRHHALHQCLGSRDQDRAAPIQQCGEGLETKRRHLHLRRKAVVG